jgi:hypothetical protein
MLALVVVVLLAGLFWVMPGTSVLPLFFSAVILSPLTRAIYRYQQANDLYDLPALRVEFGIVALLAVAIGLGFAWGAWRTPTRRRLYINLMILSIGIPADCALGMFRLAQVYQP